MGLAEMKVSAAGDDTLVAYALGSCLGVAVHDPLARVGGLLHATLPAASLDPARARAQPSVFVDSGLAELFRACYALGARKERMIVKAAGGAAGAVTAFRIGEQNVEALERALGKNGVLLTARDVGGRSPRTICLAVASGAVTVNEAPL